MIVNVMESTKVQPAQDTPKCSLRLSKLDQVMPRLHIPTVYFYRPTNGCPNFFDPQVLKSALMKTLVPYFPMAGRLSKDKDGKIEINCNGEGALFIEAQTDSILDDLGDFTPALTTELKQLVPMVDSTKDISSYPILLLQVTYFKCGGVSLGSCSHHTVADGPSQFHFIKYWSEVARGLNPNIKPFIDPSLMRARDPPTPSFNHIEYQPPPFMNTPPQSHTSETSPTVALLKISRDQLNLLKSKCKDMNHDTVNYSSFEALTGHVWRCMCRARALPKDQQTVIYIPANGRARLRPALPPFYFGNVAFTATATAAAGDLITEQLTCTVRRIHDALIRMDDEYLRSALDYLEVQPDLTQCIRMTHPLGHANISVVSWAQLPLYDADFGWGQPLYMGPVVISFEGQAYVLPDSTNAGGLILAISLHAEHMVPFQKYFSDF